jgi:adenosylmethionine-8-amino-7-oxononanoate aminotransferase
VAHTTQDPADDLLARDRRALWHPYTQHGLEADPLPVASAQGALLRLADGRELIDAISSWWTCLHGHGTPEIAAAIGAQAARLDHVLFAGATHAPAVELAERLLALAPRGLARVFYSDNGSTAVEVALKLLVQAHAQRGEPQRRVFVCFEGGYHGDTFGAMAVGDPDPYFEPWRSLLFEVRRVELSQAGLERALSELGPRAAGVLVEPLVQGAGGMRMHAPELLRALAATCRARGVPLVADEVMTGFGRTGALFACARAGVEPDLLCLAKGLTGGTLPLAATLVRADWFEAFRSRERSRAFFHGHSFTANPIACAAALASLELVRTQRPELALERIGAQIEAELLVRLPQARTRYALRRTGGIVALDVPERAGERAGYLNERALRLRAAAIERGVLLRPLGPVLYALPPACTSSAQAQQIARALAELALLED